MRQIVQIALTRSEAERAQYLRGFHSRHHERTAGALDSFVRWAYSDPRLDHVPALLAEIERPATADEVGLRHEAEVLVRMRAQGRSPAQRVQDYLNLLGAESSEKMRSAVASLLPPTVDDATVAATIRLMRRAWLDLYGDDPFFAEA